MAGHRRAGRGGWLIGCDFAGKPFDAVGVLRSDLGRRSSAMGSALAFGAPGVIGWLHILPGAEFQAMRPRRQCRRGDGPTP